MKQIHLVQSVSKKYGGIAIASSKLASEIADESFIVTLYVLDDKISSRRLNSLSTNLDVCSSGGSNIVVKFARLIRCLKNGSYDVLHIHGIWSPIFTLATLAATYFNIKVIVSPHGCLQPFAINHRSLKKRFALSTYIKILFRNTSMFFATSLDEFTAIRGLGVNKPVAVLPIGIDKPTKANIPKVSFRKKILFLSRIHPIKGLLDLVDACSLVPMDGWKIIIAGPDEDNYSQLVKARISELCLDEYFDFIGMVSGEAKELLYYDSDIFVLPTYSENFGIVIAESLAHGLPVITTTAAPWCDIRDYRCGWWIEPGAINLAKALNAAMCCDENELKSMGLRGMELIERKYSWKTIRKQACTAYKWLELDSVAQPTFIHN